MIWYWPQQQRGLYSNIIWYFWKECFFCWHYFFLFAKNFVLTRILMWWQEFLMYWHECLSCWQQYWCDDKNFWCAGMNVCCADRNIYIALRRIFVALKGKYIMLTKKFVVVTRMPVAPIRVLHSNNSNLTVKVKLNTHIKLPSDQKNWVVMVRLAE